MNADATGRELGPPPSPATLYPSLGLSSSCDPSLHPVTPDDQSLEGQAIQHDDGCTSRKMLEQLRCSALVLSDDEKDETEKWQQQPKSGKDREQAACNSDTSSNSDIDTMTTTSKTTTRAKVYKLLSSASCLPQWDQCSNNIIKR